VRACGGRNIRSTLPQTFYLHRCKTLHHIANYAVGSGAQRAWHACEVCTVVAVGRGGMHAHAAAALVACPARRTPQRSLSWLLDK